MGSKNPFGQDATPASSLDQEPAVRLDSDEGPRSSTPCYDCEQSHLPRRVVCCIDGTWMGPDGEVGAENGASPNMFRIWASVKEGEVQDSTGKRWLQIRKYFEGIDAESPRLWGGITGEGFERLIFQVYKFCAHNCCPSRDEVYMFGFSRGAFVARAVGALLYHLQTLNPRLQNFDKEYQKGIKLYQGMRNRADFHKNKLYHHLSANALPPVSVKFVGVIDTVKAIDDGGLYDIQQTPNVSHVRHALALLERREAYALERYRKPIAGAASSMLAGEQHLDRTCVEAWFLGGHENVGGCKAQDSLALWPLQFLLAEAQKQGLVLGFKPHEDAKIANPIELSMPSASLQQCIPFNNGLNVDMWDLSRYFQNASGMRPIASISSAILRERERCISDSDLTTAPTTDGFYVIIHPSVYYHDDAEPLGILYLNQLEGRHAIRRFRKSIAIRRDDLFWNEDFGRKVDLELRRPRVLVCGSHGIGKSSVVNLVAGQEITEASSQATSFPHEINTELGVVKNAPDPSRDFLFHDSRGWDTGSHEPYGLVDDFLKDRRAKPVFTEQLHCIWYCLEATQSRISTSDKTFFQTVDRQGVTLIIVFTRSDFLASECESIAQKQVLEERSLQGPIKRQSREVRDEVERRSEEIYEAKKASRIEDFRKELGFQFDCVFASRFFDDDWIEKLVNLTRSSLQSGLLHDIHERAIRSKLDQILPTACRDAADMKEFLRPSVPLSMKWDNMFDDVDEKIKEAMELRLPGLFGFTVGQDARFTKMEDIFEAANESRMSSVERGWLEFCFAPMLQLPAAIASSGLSVGAFIFGPVIGLSATAVGAVAQLAKEIPQAFYRAKFMLVQLSLHILAHERMFWFGVPNITREMAARAWIDVLKLAPDVERRVQKEVNIFVPDDWNALLSGVVTSFRHDEYLASSKALPPLTMKSNPFSSLGLSTQGEKGNLKYDACTSEQI